METHKLITWFPPQEMSLFKGAARVRATSSPTTLQRAGQHLSSQQGGPAMGNSQEVP